VCLAQQVSFQVSYDVGLLDLFANVKQTSDNGYIIGGSPITLLPIGGLIKTDSMGTVVWAKTYDEGFFGPAYSISDVQQTMDGGYIATGQIGNGVMLMKTNATGSVTFTKRFGGSNTDYGSVVKQTSDGGYIIAGSSFSFSSKDSANFYLLKTNSSGTLLWDKVYQISTIDDENGMALEELVDGYLIAGSTPQVFGSDTTRDAVLIKTNLNGEVTWARTYGSDTYSEEIYDVKLISTNEILISGYTTEPSTGSVSDVFIMKTDTTGSVTYSTSYNIGFEDLPYSVQETSDGGFAAMGWTITNLFPLTIKTFLLKTSNTGTVQISMQYGAGVGSIFGKGEQTSDGGYVLGSMQGNTSWDFHLYKTDNTGSTVCNQTSTGASQNAYVPPATTPGVSTFSGGSTSNRSPSANNVTPITTVLCINAPCLPAPDPTLTITDANVCLSETGVIYTSQSGFDSYTWTVTGGTIASGQGTNSITVDWGTGPSGTVNLVIDSSGCAGNLITENVSIADPAPTLTSTDTQVCDGETSVIYTTQAGFSTYTWTVSGGTIASGAGTNSITVDWGSPGAGTVNLTVVDAFGCTGSLSATENVTINASPTPTLTVTDTVVCDGQTGVTYVTQTGFATYTWAIGGGTIASGAGTSSITVNWGPPGAGTVDLTVVDAFGCTGSLSATENVTINANPTPTLTISDTVVCEGQIGVTYTTQSGFSTYTWTIGGGTIASGSGTDSITVDWGTGGGGTVDLTVVDTNGCTGSLSSTQSVTIYANPSPTLTVSETIVCENELDVIYTTQSGFSTYIWTVSGGSISSGDGTNSILVDWGSSGVGSVNLNVIDTNGCAGLLALTVSVTILSTPTAIITPSGTTNFCTGDSIQLSSDVATTYLWLLNGSTTGLTSQNIYVTTPGDYQVVVTNAAGCTDTSAISTLVENPSPTATITASGSTTFCSNDSVTLTADTASIYLWFLNGSSTGQTSQSIVVMDAGNYQVAISNAFCQDTSAITTITIDSVPTLDISSTVADSSNCGSSDGSITGTVANGTSPFTYEWTNSVGTVVGGDSANLVNVPADTYTLVVTDSIGCTASLTLVVFDIGAPPTPIASADASYCQGDPIADLTATGSGGTLIWYSDSLLNDSVGTGSPFTSGATVSDTFYVSETIAGCEGLADTVVITINPTPAQPVASGDSTYCQGDAITDLTVTGGGGTFTWYSDPSLAVSIGSGTPFASGLTTSDTVYVTEDVAGCESIPDTVIITFIATPVGLTTIGDSSYCQGDSVADLTATGSGGTITWYSNSGLTDTVFTGSPFASGAVSDTIFYVTETSNGCASATDSVTITFATPPIVIVTSSVDTICPGGDVTLTALGANSYVWSTGDTGSVIVVNPTVLTVYTVTGSNSGCAASPISIAVVTDSSLNPIVVIDQGPTVTVCQGESVTLSASGGNSYLWSTGDTTSTITVSPVVNTVYTVTGMTTGGCTSAADTTTVTISSGSIIAGFTANPTTGSIPLDVAFTDTSIGAVSWQWDFSYDSIFFNIESIDQNPNYTYIEGGNFQVILIASDANGCSDTASLILTLNVTEEVFIPNLFTPNGDNSNDVLYVRGNGIDDLLLIIYDRWGEKVYEGAYSQAWALEDTYPTGIGWDGTFNDQPMNPAVFVYVLTGTFISGDAIDQKGNITLVR